ncbi:MAG: hemolysin family protein [Thermodesulfobacteriota bacterium]
MTETFLADIVLMLVLLALSAFFSSAETAFFSIPKTKAIHLARESGGAFALILRLKEDPHTLLTTLLIGNNLINIGASAFATSIALKIFPVYAISIAIGVVTFFILVFGEVFPKSIAAQNNILIARLTVYPIFWLSILFRPVVWFLNFIPRITQKLQPPNKVSEEELLTFVEMVEEEGEIKQEERELIHKIFRFDDTSASEIMTPRADMFVIDINRPFDLKAVAESGFTRIPVIENDIDHVIGILNIKDVFFHQATRSTPIDIRRMMREPYFVPENKKLDRLLHQFKKRKNHIAIVVDEYGGVSGLISLEDVLEEIVGEISDETDTEEPYIIKTKPNEWIVLGKTDIEEVNRKIPLQIPDSREYDTFSGFILSHIGHIPHEKEEIHFDPFLIIVKEMAGNRINRLLVRQLADEPASDPA